VQRVLVNKVKNLPTLSIKGVKEAILSLGDSLKDAEAVGVCGSLARGDFGKRSDIDVFVVVKDGMDKDVDTLWWRRIRDALKHFRRDVTVIVYSVKGLEKIITWYVLRLASEGVLVYDKSGIKDLFKEIVRTAKEAGLVEKRIGNRRVWSAPNLRVGERLVLEVKDSGER
jgi:predicted nucleotidyltransferase